MARFVTVVEVAATPDEAFAFLSDPANRKDWDQSVRSVVGVGEVDASVGDQYEVTVGFYGKAIDTIYEITESDRPSRVVSTVSGRVRGREVIEISASESGSSVSLEMEIQLKGAARLLDRGFQLAFGGIGENAAAGLKKCLR